MTKEQLKWLQGGLSNDEYYELIGLEYVLTWRYSKDENRDHTRYRMLSDKLWEYREKNPLIKI